MIRMITRGLNTSIIIKALQLLSGIREDRKPSLLSVNYEAKFKRDRLFLADNWSFTSRKYCPSTTSSDSKKSSSNEDVDVKRKFIMNIDD